MCFILSDETENTPDQPNFNVNSSAEANLIVNRTVNCDSTDRYINSNADKFNQFIDSSRNGTRSMKSWNLNVSSQILATFRLF